MVTGRCGGAPGWADAADPIRAISATAVPPSQSVFLTFAPVSFELVQGGKHLNGPGCRVKTLFDYRA